MLCKCLAFFWVDCGREEILVKKPTNNPVSGSSHVSLSRLKIARMGDGGEWIPLAKPTYYQYDLKFLAKIYFRTN